MSDRNEPHEPYPRDKVNKNVNILAFERRYILHALFKCSRDKEIAPTSFRPAHELRKREAISLRFAYSIPAFHANFDTFPTPAHFHLIGEAIAQHFRTASEKVR